MVDSPELPEQWRRQCFLKGPEEPPEVESHAFIVSGERLCKHFREGLSSARERGKRRETGQRQIAETVAGCLQSEFVQTWQNLNGI